MDVSLVRARLGMAPDTIVGLTCLEYTPTSVDPPCFYPGELDIGYRGGLVTFNGQPSLEVVCTVLAAPEANDQEGQKLLDAYLTHTGSTSIKAAIESDQTLSGACRSVFVHDIDGYRIYTVGQNRYYGARFRVQVLGG